MSHPRSIYGRTKFSTIASPTLRHANGTAKLVPQSYKVWWTPTTYAAWRYIPSTAIVATDDLAAPHASRLLKAAMDSSPSMVNTVEIVEGGHSPMLSHAEWLVGVLKKRQWESE